MWRGPICLILWMGAAAAAAQDARPAVVRYTHLGDFASGVVRVGAKAYASAGFARQVGWTLRATDDEADIQAEGRRIRVALQSIGGERRFALLEALSQLGADAQWDSAGSVLVVRGVVRNLEVRDGDLRLDSTLAGFVKTFRLEDPTRLVVDVAGAMLPTKTRFSVPAGVRIGQYTDHVVRLVIEGEAAARLQPPAAGIARSVRLDLAPMGLAAQPPPTAPVTIPSIAPLEEPPEADPASSSGTVDEAGHEHDDEVVETALPAATGVPVELLEVLIEPSDLEGTQIIVRAATAFPVQPTALYQSPTRVELQFPGALGRNVPIRGSSPLIASARWSTGGRGPSLVVDLARPLAFQFGVSGARVTLELIRPKASSGRLAGKVVVVDAGHGGDDPGATHGGVREKVVALSTARRIARALTAEGVSVILTRSDDTRIPLRERSEVANRSRAHFFISVHFNSNSVANSASGTQVYFHQQDPVCRLLAQCLQSELVKSLGLPDMGARSDSRIYTTGFAVLRYAKMPAVLLELAYVNHSGDRAVIVTEAFQEKAAQGVVRGLKVFLNDEKP